MNKILLLITMVLTFSSCISFHDIKYDNEQWYDTITSVTRKPILPNLEEYVFFEKTVKCLVKMEENNPLQIDRAKDIADGYLLDLAEKKYSGHYLKNMKYYVSTNGRWLKVVADVWGVKANKPKSNKKSKRKNKIK